EPGVRLLDQQELVGFVHLLHRGHLPVADGGDGRTGVGRNPPPDATETVARLSPRHMPQFSDISSATSAPNRAATSLRVPTEEIPSALVSTEEAKANGGAGPGTAGRSEGARPGRRGP